MAEKPTPYQDLSWIRNDGLLPYTNPRPSDSIGRWEYWTQDFKKAFSVAGEAGTPFSHAKKNGSTSWQDTDTFGDDSRLKLIDYDGGTDSGYVTFTMADGWQGMFYLYSDNDDFFDDNIKENYIYGAWNDDDPHIEEIGEAVNDLEDEGWPAVWVQSNAEYTDSRAITGLDSGDYMSFDIDDESPNAAQARIRIGGDDYLSNTAQDTHMWITCIYLRKWNADYIWEEAEGPPEKPDDDEEEEDDPENPCPAGQELNEYGICVLVTPPEPEVCGDGFIWDPDTASCVPIIKPEDDITGAEMAAVIAAVAGVIFLAIKVV